MKRATGRRGLDGYDRSTDAAWQGRAARSHAGKPPAAYLRVIACPGCWCGQPMSHDWPGKAAGAPHPR